MNEEGKVVVSKSVDWKETDEGHAVFLMPEDGAVSLRHITEDAYDKKIDPLSMNVRVIEGHAVLEFDKKNYSKDFEKIMELRTLLKDSEDFQFDVAEAEAKFKSAMLWSAAATVTFGIALIAVHDRFPQAGFAFALIAACLSVGAISLAYLF